MYIVRKVMLTLIVTGLLALAACKQDKENPIPGKETCPLTEAQRQVIAEVNQYAIPFTTTDPEAAPNDLAPLDPMLSNAKIVGMGEATHGTKEFSQMRYRLFKHMVTRHGYKAIVFETSWGAAWYLNRYVRNESNELIEPLSGLGWVWTNKEVLALIRWMRQYNAGKAEADQIFFYGFDMQSNDFEFKLIEEYIGKVDPQWLSSLKALYQPFKDTSLDTYGSKPESFKADVRQHLQQAYDYMTSRQAVYISKSSAREYQEVLYTGRVLQQIEDFFKGGGDYGQIDGNLRDKYMAENAQWIQAQMGADSKIALWAHNFHVANISTANSKAMGWNLKNALGEAYQIIGFSFATGSVTARELTQGPGNTPQYGPLKAFDLVQPICESTNHLFHQATHKKFLLNLKAVPSGTALHTWITTAHPDRHIGAVYGKDYDRELYFDQTKLGEFYDWTIYFDQTTASEQITSADL